MANLKGQFARAKPGSYLGVAITSLLHRERDRPPEPPVVVARPAGELSFQTSRKLGQGGVVVIALAILTWCPAKSR